MHGYHNKTTVAHKGRGVRDKIEVVKPCIGFCDHTVCEARHLGGSGGMPPPPPSRKILDIRDS